MEQTEIEITDLFDTNSQIILSLYTDFTDFNQFPLYIKMLKIPDIADIFRMFYIISKYDEGFENSKLK